MKDKISVERLNKLHPKVRSDFKVFIEAAETELNTTLRITQGLRTIEEQNALYAKGRTPESKAKGEKIVTNAKGGCSYHNYGLAIDLVEMKDGKANWDFDFSRLAPIAARYGIEWGGNFKSLLDRPHFQIPLGHTVSQLASTSKDRLGYVLI